MSQQDQSKAFLVGGLIVGVLSVIPLVNTGNVCCCLWAWIGGAVAAKLLINGSPRPVTIAEGAKIGLLAGGLGAFIRLFIGLPIELVTLPWQLRLADKFAKDSNNERLQEFLKPMIEQFETQGLGQQIIGMLPGAIIGAVVLLGFTVLGGIVGVKLFEKRQNQTPPPYDSSNYPPPPAGNQGGWPQS